MLRHENNKVTLRSSSKAQTCYPS